MVRIDVLLDTSMASLGVGPQGRRRALSHSGYLTFDALAQTFRTAPHKEGAVEVLTTATRSRVEAMVHQNPTRRNLRQSFAQIIEDYNEGVQDVDDLSIALLEFMKRLDAEIDRARAEPFTQDHLAIHDFLMAHAQKLGPVCVRPRARDRTLAAPQLRRARRLARIFTEVLRSQHDREASVTRAASARRGTGGGR